MQGVKAAVIVSPGRLEIREFPYPALDRGCMLVRMEYSGICGTDKHTFRGETKQHAGTAAESTIPFPIIPGHETVGTIAEIGGEDPIYDYDGKELHVGDRIVMCPDVVCGKCFWCRHNSGFPLCENIRSWGTLMSCKEPPHLFGGWAEYVYIPPEVFVFKVPEGLCSRVAVLAELMAVSANLDKARDFSALPGEGISFGDTVVVYGVGPMGLCHVIKARLMGAGIIVAIDISDFRLGLAKEFGADYVLNAGTIDRPERIEMVKSLTDGRGADLVVECAGVPQVVTEGLEMTRRGGIFVEAGNFVDMGETSINPHKHLCAKNIRLIGLTGHPPNAYASAMAMLERYSSLFPFEKIVTHEYKIEQAREALEKSMDPSSMKVVITP